MLKSLVTQLFLLALGGKVASSRMVPRQSPSSVVTIPASAATGDIKALYTSTADGLDAPKLLGINSTSWDWWYFDAVSPNLNTSLVIVFYTALPSGNIFLPPSKSANTIGVYTTFPNGTINAKYLPATEAVVTTNGQGSAGEFVGTGGKWEGSSDMSTYTVTIDSPDNGVVGTMKLVSKAPAHYPAGPPGAGQNMMVGPNIGWSNAMPDADGDVDFTIGDTKLAFKGIGYHDKNWSDRPLGTDTGSWYWGHARLGPYSLVWFDFLSTNGTNYVSSYVAKDNKIIASSVKAGTIKVRPVGSDYPAKIMTPKPSGFTISVDLGEGKTGEFNVTVAAFIANSTPVYTRFTGSVTGVVEGNSLSDGIALFEQFKFKV